MESIIVLVIILVLSRLFRSIGKRGANQTPTKQQQAVEEQRLRREAYEQQQRQLMLDEEEAAAPSRPLPTAAEQQLSPRMRQDQQQRQRQQQQRPPRPARQPSPPAPPQVNAPPQISAQPAPTPTPLQKPRPAMANIAAPRRGGMVPPLTRQALVQGIIMAEVLGPPRSKQSLSSKRR